MVYPPKTVTHPSTNRARRRVTSLIRPTTLPLRHLLVVAVFVIIGMYGCMIVANDWQAAGSRTSVSVTVFTTTTTATSTTGRGRTTCVTATEPTLTVTPAYSGQEHGTTAFASSTAPSQPVLTTTSYVYLRRQLLSFWATPC